MENVSDLEKKYYINPNVGVMFMGADREYVACAYRPCCRDLKFKVTNKITYFYCSHILITDRRILISPHEKLTHLGPDFYIIKNRETKIYSVFNAADHRLVLERKNIIGPTEDGRIIARNYNSTGHTDIIIKIE